MQLSFLGLLSTAMSIRPTHNDDIREASLEVQQKLYLSWLERELTVFQPFPRVRSVDYDHLQGMSCIDIMRIGQRDLSKLLMPRDLPQFTWPEGYFDKNEIIVELKQIDGLLKCSPTTVGSVIGTHVHDIKLNEKPTVFLWDESD